MTEAPQLYSSNGDEDIRDSTPVETGSIEKRRNKWVWQVETTPLASVAVLMFPDKLKLKASAAKNRSLMQQPPQPPAQITEAITAKQNIVSWEQQPSPGITEAITAKQSVVQCEENRPAVSEMPTVPLKAVGAQYGAERAGEGEEKDGLLILFREKRFTFKGMSYTQRLISGLAIGLLLLSALLILLNFFPHPLIQLDTFSGSKAIGISPFVFVAVLIFYLLSWSFFLSGALHGNILMRIVILSIFTFVQVMTAITAPSQPPLLLLGGLCLSGIFWLWGLIMFLLELRTALKQMQEEDHAQQEAVIGPDRSSQVSTFLPVLALLFVYYGLLLGYCLRLGNATPQANLVLFNKLIYLNMMAMTVFLLPALFLAGAGLAGLGEALMRSGAALIARIQAGTPWLLALVTALFAAYLVYQDLPDRTLNTGNWLESLCSQLALGVGIIALLGGVVYLAGLRRWSPLRIKTRILVIAMFSILILGDLIPQVAITLYTDVAYPLPPVDTLNFSIYKQSKVPPYFSLAYPSDWPVTVKVNNPVQTAIVFIDTDSSVPAYFIIARRFLTPGQQVSPPLDLKKFLIAFCDTCSFSPQTTTSQGPWQLIRYQVDSRDGIAWIRDDNGQSLILTGMADPGDMSYDEPIFTAMVNSWSPDLHATVPPPDNALNQERQILSNRVAPLTSGLIPLLIGLLALPLLFWQRKRPGLLATGALFFIVMGILQFPSYLQGLIAARIPQAHLDFYFSGLLLTASVGTLLTLCWLLIRRKITRENIPLLTLLLMLNGGLWFVSFLYWFYGQVSGNGLDQTGTVILQALLLLVAFGWAIFTSGEKTNNGSDGFPRSVRLLLFLGYMMLASTCVLYFFSQVSFPQGALLRPDQLFFGGQNWPQIGLLRLGVPLIVTTFLLQLAYWWRSRHQEADISLLTTKILPALPDRGK